MNFPTTLLMLQQFLNYIQKEQLVCMDDCLLLAVSGGIDSVVMTDLCHKANISFGMAHCNFQLRGVASDADAQLVRELAQKYDVPFFITHFDTISYTATHKRSTQVAARELRYEWLRNIQKNNHFTNIATGHHLNDSIETALYNLAKGTGISGIRGILPKNGNIIRPLLFATREAIAAYAHQNNLQWREDASNATDKYQRNFIRHHIVPLFKEINPSFEASFEENFEHFRATECIWKDKMAEIAGKYTTKTDDKWIIDLCLVQDLAHLPIKSILFELLREYDFNGRQVENILAAKNGSVFYTSQYELLKTQAQLIIKAIVAKEITNYYWVDQATTKIVMEGKTFLLEWMNTLPDFSKKEPNMVCFNGEKLVFPLKIRHWQAGDVFQPFGMDGKKQKVKDFLTNKKVNIWEKSKVLILENGNGEVIWVVGYRTDERYKVETRFIASNLHIRYDVM
jgi:tRNA(Ile)-lysidine synthase